MKISFICHWNNELILHRYLLKSLERREGDEVVLVKGHRSLASGYVAGEAKATNDLLVFVHQDVEMPPTWREQLEAQIQAIATRDPDWGVIGVFGSEWVVDADATLLGINCCGSGEDLGGVWADPRFPLPRPAHALDSCVLVKKRGVPAFDAKVPTFHGAAEDLCLTARRAKRGVWIADVYTKHWSTRKKPVTGIEADLKRCATYLVKKWKSDIPSATRLWEHSMALRYRLPIASVDARMATWARPA